MSQTLKPTGVDHFGGKFGEAARSQILKATWERHGAVIRKRNRVDIFYHLSTMHERERQTAHGMVTSIPIGEIAIQRRRLKTMSAFTSESQS